MVNRRDLNSTIHADRELCEWFRNAAKEAGVPCKTGVVPLFGGSTDATAFLQEGFRAVTITGLNHVLEDYYHTRKDTYDNLNEEGLENCYKATVCLLDRMEREE
jgi:putative aminopeptidase FrvX